MRQPELPHRSLRDDAGERLRRMVGTIRARWLLRGCDAGRRVCAWRSVRVVSEGNVRVGDGVQFWSGPLAQELVCLRGAELEIGADS
ncbi:MAG: hypothetical protein ACJ79Y_08280, partial [Myxococcales bacterium]